MPNISFSGLPQETERTRDSGASRNTPGRYTLNGFVAALGVFLVALAVWHASRWRFVCDDAYIALRYAKHWAQGWGPVYNAGQTGVQGFTSPLWVALIALAHRLGAGCVAAALGLNVLGALLCAVASVGVSSALAPATQRAKAALLCLGSLALCPEFLVWASGGLETSFAAGFGLLALGAVLRGRSGIFHVAAAIAACVRLDTLVWVLPCAMILGRNAGKGFVRGAWPLAWLAPGLVLMLQWSFYGSMVPQTFFVKRGSLDLALNHGLGYLQQWAVGAGLGLALLIALSARARFLPWLASIFANLGYVLWVGGDFMGYSRFLLPATLLSLTLASAQIAQLGASSQLWVRRAALLGALLILGVMAWRVPSRLAQDEKQAWLDKRYESVHAMERFAAIRVAAGKAFASKWPSGTKVTVGAAGAFAFAADFETYDAFGLTDPQVLSLGQHRAKGRPGHRWVGGGVWVKAHRPQLRCEIGWVGVKVPDDRALRARRPLTSKASWACAPTGPVLLRGEARPLASRYYCCVNERFASRDDH